MPSQELCRDGDLEEHVQALVCSLLVYQTRCADSSEAEPSTPATLRLFSSQDVAFSRIPQNVVQEGGVDELDAATVMQQILRGVAYMHNHKSLGLRCGGTFGLRVFFYTKGLFSPVSARSPTSLVDALPQRICHRDLTLCCSIQGADILMGLSIEFELLGIGVERHCDVLRV